MKIHCYGCGSSLQTTDKKSVGYVDEKQLDKEQILCYRCYQMQHYNKIIPTTLKADDFYEILNKIKDRKALYVYVIDIFDLNSINYDKMFEFLDNKKVLLVINKVDVLPKAINPNKLRLYVKKHIDVDIVDSVCCSSKNKLGIDTLLKKIYKYSDNQNVYIVGASNVGKSSLLNAMLASTGIKGPTISTNNLPGTTLDLIEIELEDSYLYDTPGIIYQDSVLNYVNANDLKKIIPKKEIKSTTFQLNSKQAVLIENLAIVAFEDGVKSGLTFYMSNELNLHRTKLLEIERIMGNDKLHKLETEIDFKDMEVHKFNIPSRKVDLVISGLGFVTIHGIDDESFRKMKVYTLKNVSVTIREALI